MKNSSAIAIVGMSCRFPGNADTPEAFWKLMENKTDAVHDIPRDRWNIDHYYDPERNTKGKMYTRQGGFLTDVDLFDNMFFKISPLETESLDPQVRLMLELSYEVFEDAGVDVTKLNGSSTGVFIGMTIVDYIEKDIRSANPNSINAYSVTGTQMSSASGRISYAFGLEGPSISLDTACSSSLMSVHLACQSLITGESALAVAGGVNLILSPRYHVAFCELGALANDSRSKAFDASADGFVRSEGAGLILLKRYEDAVKDNDNILAVICGTGVTNDGTSKGYTVPRMEAQAKAIQIAMQRAGVSTDDIDYYEAHGTGTPVGDPIEMEGIATTFSSRKAKEKLYVGSVKTNIGHCESAAGIAGLIKTVLALRNNKIPANLHFNNPNPAIQWDSIPVQIPVNEISWLPGKKGRHAAVSAFGLSGTNVSAIVSEVPATGSINQQNIQRNTDWFILPVAAATMPALKQLISRYIKLLNESDENEWMAICAGAALHRSHLECRYAAGGSSKSELLESLSEGFENDAVLSNNSGLKKIVFVFPGQGSQWIGMGRELMQKEEVFSYWMLQCDQALRSYVNWSLIEEIAKGEEKSRFKEVDVIQPILFSVEISLAKLWESRGIKPDVVIGHSMGEVAAAFIAGTLTLHDAAAVICKRSALAKTVSGEGAMALVELGYKEAAEIIKGYETTVAIGACNGPRSTVLSGTLSDINLILEKLSEKEIFNRFIKVDYASHSPQMDQLRPLLYKQLHEVRPVNGTVPVYSTVYNKFINGADLNCEYWADNLRSTVLFSQAVEELLKTDDCIFVEVSPHPVLVQLIEQGIEFFNKPFSAVVYSVKRDMPESGELIRNFRNVYQSGAAIDWKKFYGDTNVVHNMLPAYPWQKERFWINESPTFSAGWQPGEIHPFLSRELKFANNQKLICWEGAVNLETVRYLKDHQVKGTAIFPAAGYLELVYAALCKSFGNGIHQLKNIVYKHPLFLGSTVKLIQLVLKIERENSLQFQLYSSDVSDNGAAAWEIHCEGNAMLFRNEPENLPDENFHNNDWLAFPLHFTKEHHYQIMSTAGIDYGEPFRGVQEIWANDKRAIGKIDPSDNVKMAASRYCIHPAILDACFQVSMASMIGRGEEITDVYLPSDIESFSIKQGAGFGQPLWVQIESPENVKKLPDVYTKNIVIRNESGECLAMIDGFSFKKLKENTERTISNTFYKFNWQQFTIAAKPEERETSHCWLVFRDAKNADRELMNFAIERGDRVIIVKASVDYKIVEAPDLTFEINIHNKEHYAKLFDELNNRNIPVTDVVYLWGVVEQAIEPSLAEAHYLGLMYLIQCMSTVIWPVSPKLTVVTSAVHQLNPNDRVNVFAAPVLGMARVVFHEHAEFNCTRIDICIEPANESRLLAELLYVVTDEKEFVLRDNKIFVPRLDHYEIPSSPSGNTDLKTLRADAAVAYRFVTDEPGVLENIKVRETVRLTPREDEIEVEVAAAGLNFMNVMSALGIYPGEPKGFLCLGIEFSGVVKSTGAAVLDMKPGDRVIGLSPKHDCLGKYTICKALQAVKIPDNINMADAATIAVAYGTAYTCLMAYGKLKKGERVLIHSATGGVGTAAIEVAQNAGAEIYATAGTEEKRQMLRDKGVKYVMDSHSLDFAKQIREYTNGEGIDMVLNSLTGEAMYESIKLLRGFGRFLEIGKKDIYENSSLSMDIFRESISYTFFDLHKMLNERPDLVKGYLEEVMKHFERNEYKPVPKTVFPVSRAIEGFDMMAKGKHNGKIVFDMNDPHLMIEPASTLFKENETYIITGGMGGLGFGLARWMCERGAVNLVLIGRSAPDEERQKQIDDLIAAKKNIVIFTGDISDETVVSNVLKQVRLNMPPLKGIFHLAGTLSDSSIARLDEESFRKPLAPKIRGAWNLHNATLHHNLRYFVLYSSIASSLGSIGQANYVAGNAFLDALSKERQAMGLPVSCINWGPVAEVGLAAKDAIRGKRLEKEGIAGFTPDEYLEATSLVLTLQLSDVNIFDLDYEKWVRNNPSYAEDKLLQNLGNANRQLFANSFVQQLKEAVSTEDAMMMMQAQLQELLGGILKMPAKKIDIDIPFANMGLDSLMAIQLRNKLQKLLGIQISVTTFWNYPKVRLISRHVLDVLEVHPDIRDKEPMMTSGSKETVDRLVAQMSESDMIAELDRELNTL